MGNEYFMITSDRSMTLHDGLHLPAGTTVLYQGHVVGPDGYHTPRAAMAKLATGHIAVVDAWCFPELRFGRHYA